MTKILFWICIQIFMQERVLFRLFYGHLLLMRKGTSDMVAVQVALRGYVHETNLEGKEEISAGGQHAHAEWRGA